MNKDTIKILSDIYDSAAEEHEKLNKLELSAHSDEISALDNIMKIIEDTLNLCTFCKTRVCDENKNNYYSFSVCDNCWNS